MPAAPGAAGPLVAVCSGHRCLGLQRLHECDFVETLRPVIRETHAAVLLRTPCQGRCHLGPLVTLGRPGSSHRMVLGGMERPGSLDILIDWLRGIDVGSER